MRDAEASSSLPGGCEPSGEESGTALVASLFWFVLSFSGSWVGCFFGSFLVVFFFGWFVHGLRSRSQCISSISEFLFSKAS